MFEHGYFISALEHVRMLILRDNVLLACINAVDKLIWSRLADLVIRILRYNFWVQELII